MPEPHRDLLRSSHVAWRPRKGFRPIWGVLSDDEDTSGSLSEFIDAANDVQSIGTILEDGVAPGYCDVGSPNTAGGDLGCSDNSGSNHVAVADSSTTEAPERHVTYPAVANEPSGTKNRR